MVSILYLRTSRWCLSASRRRFKASIVSCVVPNDSERSLDDSDDVHSTGLHDEPSPSQTSQASYVQVPSTLPQQSRHDEPSPAQMSHRS